MQTSHVSSHPFFNLLSFLASWKVSTAIWPPFLHKKFNVLSSSSFHGVCLLHNSCLMPLKNDMNKRKALFLHKMHIKLAEPKWNKNKLLTGHNWEFSQIFTKKVCLDDNTLWWCQLVVRKMLFIHEKGYKKAVFLAAGSPQIWEGHLSIPSLASRYRLS